MGELQWALLIVCLVLVVAVYFFSRRNRDEAGGEEGHGPFGKPEASGDQMDLLTPRADGSYDEYGVGRKRKRGEAGAALEPSVTPREPSAPSMATLLHPLPGQPHVAPRVAPEMTPTASTAPSAAPQGKLVALIVAPTEETDILGPQLHAALAAQGLKFGDGEVYHRHIGGRIVYSVSSLLKPGKLIPAEAENFSTKGLTVVLNLPGPVTPVVAFDDMLSTTRAVASALKLEIFDARRERVTDEVGKKLRGDVEDWARAAKIA
jgi:cell division protein ZipA